MLLFALVWFSTAWFGSWEFNPNNSTRMFAALSIAEDGDATIDEFAHLTIDKAQFGTHVYLDKAPGMTLIAVPVVGAFLMTTGETTRYIDKRIDNPRLAAFLRARMRAVAILSSGLLTALAAVALWSLAGEITGNLGAALFAAIGYALGSPAWGWATTIFGHASVGALLMLAIWAAWRGTRGDRARLVPMLAAGGALGWAVVIENQAVLAGGAIGLWCLWRLWPLAGRWTAAIALIAGGLIAILPMIGYNLFVFGAPFRFGYAGVTGFDGMKQGFFGLTYPKIAVLAEILFGSRRGLFWVAPILLLAPVGLWRLIRDGGDTGGRGRSLAIVAAAVVAIVLLVNSAYAYWDGGYSTGPRHSVPAIPFLALGLAPIWVAYPQYRRGMIALLALSIAINLGIAAAEIAAPDTDRWPLWKPILTEDIAQGLFRDFPSQFWGWSPWAGMAVYLAIAGALGWALVAAHRSRQEIDRNI